MIKIYSGSELSAFLHIFDSRRKKAADDVLQPVFTILKDVRENTDNAVKKYAKKFDDIDFGEIDMQIPQIEMEKAHQKVDPELLSIVKEAGNNIRAYHQKSLPESWLSWEENDVILGQRVIPLNRVGVYVPGGRAAYPSSLLMGAIPAQVAQVNEIIITTPCDKYGRVNETILAIAFELGINRVYRIGGAHAIAAMAYGTESIPRVDKIVGPGNIYVATAKKLVYGDVGIDMVAGPSEVIIIADHSANPEYIASDMLAQAEHDPLASAILITDNKKLAAHTAEHVMRQTDYLDKRSIIKESIENYGGILLTDTMQECIELCNLLAPEHLGLHVKDPWTMMGHIDTAGAIFLGSYSPEAVGDYWAGPNHILPTNGSGRFFSPLSTMDFLKTSSIISYSRKAMSLHGQKIMNFAHDEGLDAHANSIKKRLT